MQRLIVFIFPIILLIQSPSLWAEEIDELEQPAELTSATEEENQHVEEFNKTMDGVPIEAIEIFPSSTNQECAFGFVIYPFSPYYHALGIDGSYNYAFSKTWSWEVVSGSYLFTVDKSLSAELAEDFGVSPKRIDKLNSVISSNVRYVSAFGKTVFLEKYIQSYRGAFLLGIGNVTTSLHSKLAIHFGLHFDFYVNKRYSWKMELSDYVAIPGGSIDDSNFVSIKVLTG